MVNGETIQNGNIKVNVIPATTLLDSMETAFEQMNTVLNAFGIEMYIAKVKTYKKEADEGKEVDGKDPRTIIDYIVRVEAKDPAIGMKLKEALLEKKDTGGD